MATAEQVDEAFERLGTLTDKINTARGAAQRYQMALSDRIRNIKTAIQAVKEKIEEGDTEHSEALQALRQRIVDGAPNETILNELTLLADQLKPGYRAVTIPVDAPPCPSLTVSDTE